MWDELPPKRLLHHLDTAHILELPRLYSTDRLPRFFTKPRWTADANEKARKLVRGVMFPSRRSEQLTGMIDGGVNGSGDPRSSRADGKLGMQMTVNSLGVERRGMCAMNRDWTLTKATC